METSFPFQAFLPCTGRKSTTAGGLTLVAKPGVLSVSIQSISNYCSELQRETDEPAAGL